MKLTFTVSSRDDLERIGDDIALDSPAAAQRLIRTLRERAREIAEFPYAYQVLETESGVRLRRRVVANYLIIYRVEADRVLILRVLHAARDIASLPDLPE